MWNIPLHFLVFHKLKSKNKIKKKTKRRMYQQVKWVHTQSTKQFNAQCGKDEKQQEK